jgi:FkbM family methyltransferase
MRALRSLLKAVLGRTWLGRLAAFLADRVGARQLGDRIRRLRPVDRVVTVWIPGVEPDSRQQLRMLTCGGGDLCAEIVGRDGWDAFERPMPDVFVGEVRKAKSWMIDIGANSGFYAVLARLVNPTLPVAAFEPLPHVHSLLLENVALNNLTGVEVHQAAVGAASGRATLHIPKKVFAGVIESSASLSPDFKDDIAEKLDVAVVTLDDWWSERGRPAVSVLKIDVESREMDVLRGARELIASTRPVIFYELLPQGDAGGIAELAAEFTLVDVRLRLDEAVVGDAPQFDPDAWNHLLVPEEALGETLKNVAAAVRIIDRR